MLKTNYKKDVIKFGDVFLFSVFYNLIVWLSIVMEKYLLKIFKFDDDLDDNGEIITPTGRFTASAEPTNMLHINVAFDFTDGEGYTIREFGIFTGTVLNDGLPIGQEYLLPTDISDVGQLLALERVAPIFRQAMTREIENFVITF